MHVHPESSRRPRQASAPAADDMRPRPAPANDPERRTTVLVAEDEAGIRSPLRRLLVAQGFRVLDAADGKGALEVAERFEGRIDLLLTDILMPGMNGQELARHLLLARPGVRVIFMSGYSTEAVASNGVLTPDAKFLQKPFSVEELTSRLHEALDPD
jgi:two-component system cell cycle sensor histidine kinase/response regulator CckA